MSLPMKGVDYGECAWCDNGYAGDSVKCPETGDRGHPECHEECEACRDAEPDGLDLMMERSMDAHDRRAGK